MFAALTKTLEKCRFLAVLTASAALILGGCAAKETSRISLDRSLMAAEKVEKVAVLSFEGPRDDSQAGGHVSRLFEVNLMQTNLYRILEREGVQKVLREKGLLEFSTATPEILRELGDLLRVDAIVLGTVSHYNRFSFAFTARLVSVKTGYVLWSVSQTGGMVVRPLSQVADEAVRAVVQELQAKIR
jgi:curli biogenesis system outer membrane secretion channel CsgG